MCKTFLPSTMFVCPWDGGIYPAWAYLLWMGGTYLRWGGVATLDGGYLGRGIPTQDGGYLPWTVGYIPSMGEPTLDGGTYPRWGRDTYPEWGATYGYAAGSTPVAASRRRIFLLIFRILRKAQWVKNYFTHFHHGMLQTRALPLWKTTHKLRAFLDFQKW